MIDTARVEVRVGGLRYHVSPRTAALIGLLLGLDEELSRHEVGHVTLHYSHRKLWPQVTASHPGVSLPDGVMPSNGAQ